MPESNPILDAKTLGALFQALNLPLAVGKPILEDLLGVKIDVMQKDGKPVLYCAQAITPSAEFGLAVNVQGTLVLKILDQEVTIVFSKCK